MVAELSDLSGTGHYKFGNRQVFRAHWYWRPHHGAIVYRNRMPAEIVAIFEKHGFIWGGKWYHFDTMHFEYRPELLVDK